MNHNQAVGFISQALQDFSNTLKQPSVKQPFIQMCMEALQSVNKRLELAEEYDKLLETETPIQT